MKNIYFFVFCSSVHAILYHPLDQTQAGALSVVLHELSNGRIQVNETHCPDNSHIHHYTCDQTGRVHTLSLDDENRDYTGTIATQIGLLTNLNYIDFRHSRLRGTLPTQFKHLSNLQTLLLYGNYFRGSVPAALANLPRLQLCSLELRQRPTNCFACPLPADLKCGDWQCSNSCPPVPEIEKTQTAPPSTTKTTANENPISFTKSDTTSSTVNNLETTETAGKQTLPTFESRVFTHVYRNNTQNLTLAEPVSNPEGETPHSSNVTHSMFEVGIPPIDDHLDTVIILACVLLLVIPLLVFLGIALWRSRKSKRKYNNALFSAPKEPSFRGGTAQVGISNDYQEHLSMQRPNSEYGRIELAPPETETDRQYQDGGALLARQLSGQSQYDSPHSPLERVPYNYDVAPPVVEYEKFE